MDKTEISDYFGECLLDMSWRNYYPVNKGVGLFAFSEGLKSVNILHNITKDPVRFSYVAEFKRRFYELNAEMSKEEILTGWGWHPKSSPASFYDSICEVYDRLHSCFRVEGGYKYKFGNEIFYRRMPLARTTIKHMNKILGDFFRKYHENVLQAVNRSEPQLSKPKLLDDILESEFDLDLLRQCEIWFAEQQGYSIGPTAESIQIDGWREAYNEDYFPSTSSCLDYLWALFLRKLSRVKGYPLRYPNNNQSKILRDMCVSGWDALKTLENPNRIRATKS